MASKQSELKKFFDTKKRPTRLLGHIERHMLTRPAGDRRTDVLHPSEIIKRDWCKRASYFLLRGHTKVQEKPQLRLQSIFDEGHAIHDKWQTYFYEMGVLYGKFTCYLCGHSMMGTSPETCPECNKPSMKYAELALVDESLRIAGHTDGYIKGIGDDCLIEIKSIGSGTIRREQPSLMMDNDNDLFKAWKNVRRPFGSHLLQGQMYLELVNRLGYSVEEIVFLYELKADQDYKEFVVRRDFDYVEHVFKGAEEVVKAVNANTEPECTNKPGASCPQCAPYSEDEES